MTKIRLKLVVSAGGARGDFVCGWAGLSPGALDNWWNINPDTGASSGHFFTKDLDRGAELEELLTRHGMQLATDAELCLIAPCHGTRLNNTQIDQLVGTGAVELYCIDTRGADSSKIIWEFITKTYLLHRKTAFFVNNHKSWSIDQSLTDPTNQARIQAVDEFIRRKPMTEHVREFYDDPRFTMLDYTQLFVPGGSRYLCQQLNINSSERCHQYWDAMLAFCDSPDTITVWGHEWRRSDYF